MRVIVAVLALAAALGVAYNNGEAERPAMGWNTWCAYGPCGTDRCYEWEVKAVANAMLANGMHAAGYRYINLDDCWASHLRTADGALQPSPDRFPSGIPALTAWLHARGFKFGLYTSAGNRTCESGGRPFPIPGSFGHYKQDAATFASWGVDYVKVDWCGDDLTNPEAQHTAFSHALNATGRHMWLELCRGYSYPPPPYVAAVANSWRISGDHHDQWANSASDIEHAALAAATGRSGKYNWGYNDFLMTGGQGCSPPGNGSGAHCPGMTDDEYRTNFALWSVLASPLIVSTDVISMAPIMYTVLLNMEAIAVNQENLTPAGRRLLNATDVPSCMPDQGAPAGGACQVWGRWMNDGSLAVVFFNAGSATPQTFRVSLGQLGLPPNATVVPRDINGHADLPMVRGGVITTPVVAPHASLFWRLRPLR